MSNPLVQSTGRRKEAVARVRLRPGSGIIKVNGRSIRAVLPDPHPWVVAIEPLRLTQTADVYDVDATLDGGGVSGQAGALRLGIAHRAGHARRRSTSTAARRQACSHVNDREKERRKYGLKKARKAPQYSKR